MELWTPHSFPLRVHIAVQLCLLGFRVFHDICQSRDTFLGQRTIVFPQFVHVQTFPTGVLLVQPNSDAFGRTEKLMTGQSQDEAPVEVLGERLDTAGEEPATLLPQPWFLQGNAAGEVE
jgi:hypothetical protein